MRPGRFERLLTAAINHDGRLTARTYADAGFTRSPRGIIATTPTGVPVNVQIAARLADGERHDHAEQPVTDTPYPDLERPDPIENGALDLAVFERYLASLAVAAAPDEVKTVTLFQQRGDAGAVRYGATFTYHSGGAVFLNVLSAGRARHEDFAPPATVSS
ncbi:hypothetical protein [Streptomyces bluensis]|uniref:Uncharacterized protein n=1 Tax=Streptomyces bluensis TaxID=33897 RepID=A0ABW6UY35_9ACTN